jgi:hypothetical protein
MILMYTTPLDTIDGQGGAVYVLGSISFAPSSRTGILRYCLLQCEQHFVTIHQESVLIRLFFDLHVFIHV